MMSRSSWWSPWPLRPFSLIVTSTNGFVAEPVAWQIVILPWSQPLPLSPPPCSPPLMSPVQPWSFSPWTPPPGGVVLLPAGQPPAGAGMMSRSSWWSPWPLRPFSLIVISTNGFVAEPVAWQIVILPWSQPLPLSPPPCSPPLMSPVQPWSFSPWTPPPGGVVLLPAGQPPAGAGMMSRSSWWSPWPLRPFSLIVISTNGFVAEPVAWQIVILPWSQPLPLSPPPCSPPLMSPVQPWSFSPWTPPPGGVVLLPAGQPPAGAGMMSRSSWWSPWPLRPFSLIVISTNGFVAEPVAWQIVILPWSQPLPLSPPPCSPPLMSPVQPWSFSPCSPPLGGVPAGQPPAGAGMMSRSSWWSPWPFRPFSSIVISTNGFVAEPVAWQIVIGV